MVSDSTRSSVGRLVHAVVEDPRWNLFGDNFGSAIFGFIVYGYALSSTRLFLEDPIEANHITRDSFVDVIGANETWVKQLLDNANAAAFDKKVHPGHHELILVGHSYIKAEGLKMVVDNVFENIEAWRNHQG